MNYRNVHIATLEPAAECEPEITTSSRLAPEAQPPDQIACLGRLRTVTNDPAREYARRAGDVQRLPDAVAALILCKSGMSKVERQQLKITLDNEDLFFASSNSVTIATKSGTDERVLWVVNRRDPSVLHILTRDGAYVESIPRKGAATWFSSDDASRAALAETRRMRERDMERMNQLHAPDTREALAREQHNTAEIQRLVSTFPTANDGQRQQGGTPAGLSADRAEKNEDQTSDVESEVVDVASMRGRENSLGIGGKFERAQSIMAAVENSNAQSAQHRETGKREQAAAHRAEAKASRAALSSNADIARQLLEADESDF